MAKLVPFCWYVLDDDESYLLCNTIKKANFIDEKYRIMEALGATKSINISDKIEILNSIKPFFKMVTPHQNEFPKDSNTVHKSSSQPRNLHCFQTTTA